MTPRGGAAAVTPAATAAAQDQDKKSIDPKIFVVAGLLVAALVIGSFTTGLIGGGGENPNVLPNVETINSGSEFPPPSSNQTVVVAPQINVPPAPSAPATAPDAQAPQYKIVVPPEPRQTTGVMAIMISAPNVSPQRAMSLAKFATQTIQSGGKWTGMQTFVFTDPNAARTLLKYQSDRKGARLTSNDYQYLATQGVWETVPAYYETRGRTEIPYYPASNPKSWWGR